MTVEWGLTGDIQQSDILHLQLNTLLCACRAEGEVSMKVVAWLLVAIPLFYFVVLVVVIAQHYITVGSLSANTWFLGRRIWVASIIACSVSILAGLSLMKAGK